MDFQCSICKEKKIITVFDNEADLNTHSLFEHQAFRSHCSTNLIEKEMVLADNLRKTWHILHEKIVKKKYYIQKKFNDSVFNGYGPNKYRQLAKPRLTEWVRFAEKGEGYIGRIDETFIENHPDEWDRLSSHLKQLYLLGVAKSKISIFAKKRNLD